MIKGIAISHALRIDFSFEFILSFKIVVKLIYIDVMGNKAKRRSGARRQSMTTMLITLPLIDKFKIQSFAAKLTKGNVSSYIRLVGGSDEVFQKAREIWGDKD